jgi:hypothetical protein
MYLHVQANLSCVTEATCYLCDVSCAAAVRSLWRMRVPSGPALRLRLVSGLPRGAAIEWQLVARLPVFS